ncbi:hypothetical protein FD722_02460 [Photobacterium damselae subsp. damselae]|uniref:Sel1 repeat family protein n=1 Tax=Photobacterium damselae subsp. damselae TaxID=85581 RepID=A0A850R1W8_PHODD|nr:hypothetical protein [Photobacterium damselae]MBA5681601.1 hypothetical protein [Photobacterium damselae subsp. damselae]NVP01081.1 hypothetical protein [Photobacterium damselae subsp. damselae]TLS83404.1 hypothetical protein FD719_06380 [Photobacterium damselae subsp. damselae]TLS92746.1 hypothetical protein FD722_02460 [Photobacterium damselae subsp. damselae]UKA10978.1 hypothetical protein IHC91_04690 [Photobacterium damselae subsp. damselae]
MKKIIYGLILCIIKLNPVFAMDNIKQDGYSSILSNVDRNKIYLAKNFLFYQDGLKKAIELTSPYISDKNNIEARYIYAVSLARYDLKTSLEMLKALTDEGYPYAMDTYGEKRTCQLNRYKKLCDNSGYKKLLRTMYYKWRKGNSSELFNEAYQQYYYMPYNERVNKERTWFTPKAEKLLKQCAEERFFYCADDLQKGLFSVENKNDKQRKEYDYYKKLAEDILINAENKNLIISFTENCDKSKSEFRICPSKKELGLMLTNLAKKGNLKGYESVMSYLFNNDNAKNYIPFSKYLRYPDSKLDPKLKKEYDKAIKLNNNQGWDMEMRSYSIEPYEKLYNDESLSRFFNKVNKLDSE